MDTEVLRALLNIAAGLLLGAALFCIMADLSGIRQVLEWQKQIMIASQAGAEERAVRERLALLDAQRQLMTENRHAAMRELQEQMAERITSEEVKA